MSRNPNLDPFKEIELYKIINDYFKEKKSRLMMVKPIEDAFAKFRRTKLRVVKIIEQF
jgi:hypothetical protein